MIRLKDSLERIAHGLLLGIGFARNFKVSCPNCPDNPRPAYASYTLAIRDARFVKTGSHEAVPET